MKLAPPTSNVDFGCRLCTLSPLSPLTSTVISIIRLSITRMKISTKTKPIFCTVPTNALDFFFAPNSCSKTQLPSLILSGRRLEISVSFGLGSCKNCVLLHFLGWVNTYGTTHAAHAHVLGRDWDRQISSTGQIFPGLIGHPFERSKL